MRNGAYQDFVVAFSGSIDGFLVSTENMGDEIKTVEKAPDVMTKASCQGKYQTLLRRIEVTEDQSTYGEFKDFGRWEGVEYRNHKSLPHGYWVYVAPHWHIWGESTERAAVEKKQ